MYVVYQDQVNIDFGALTESMSAIESQQQPDRKADVLVRQELLEKALIARLIHSLRFVVLVVYLDHGVFSDYA